jgi:hypothetical protein
MELQLPGAAYTIIILGLILGIMIAVIILILVVIKSKRNIETKIRYKDGEASVKLTDGTTKQSEIAGHSQNGPPKGEIINPEKFDLDKLVLHRFFNTVLVQHTSDNCIFNLYNETLRLGIIKDTEEIAQFKKLIASKYLNACLFKVLGEHIKKWIAALVKEVSETEVYDKVPNNFFLISQHITQYKNDAYKEGKTIEFKFNNKVFYGIPTKFMHRFNNWSDTNMTRVYNMISDALYSTQDTWFAKTIELLDLFEVIFIMLHDQMDATLIILNGEIANFLKKIKEESDVL